MPSKKKKLNIKDLLSKKKAKSRAKAAKTVLAVKETQAMGQVQPPPVPKPVMHAADGVDMSNIELEDLMRLAGRECSCIRLLKSQGVENPVCTGECSHAKAIEQLGDRGIVV